jgi:uncharacterized protein (TIGR02452 family)
VSLKELALQTVAISKAGQYLAPSGAAVDFSEAMEAARMGTTLYSPSALAALVDAQRPVAAPHTTHVEVTGETTGLALRRLVVDEALRDVCALNFASAKNPGGGFLGGAKAQEEDLARVSALYVTLVQAPAYYETNRATKSMIYTDHAIYSPCVPFFRDESLALREAPFVASILTMPAPNAGEHKKREGARAEVTEALDRRIPMLLAMARAHEVETLVLGAWGCGVFRNDPMEVATLFAKWLSAPAFEGAFERVVFAVYDRPEGANRAAFDRVFAGSPSTPNSR